MDNLILKLFNFKEHDFLTIFTIIAVVTFIVVLVIFLIIDYRNTKSIDTRKTMYRNFQRSPRHEVTTVYSDRAKNVSGTEILPKPTKMPTKENTYAFVGWDKNNLNESGDTVAKAVFVKIKNSYVVNFFDDDKTTLLATQMVEFGSGATFEGTIPTKSDTDSFSYTFSGWNRDISKIEEDTNVYAVYDAVPKKYTYKFYDSDRVTVLQEGSEIYGTPLKVKINPVSNDENLVFSHFENYYENMPLNKNEEFYAVYVKKEDANSQLLNQNSEQTLEDNINNLVKKMNDRQANKNNDKLSNNELKNEAKSENDDFDLKDLDIDDIEDVEDLEDIDDIDNIDDELDKLSDESQTNKINSVKTQTEELEEIEETEDEETEDDKLAEFLESFDTNENVEKPEETEANEPVSETANKENVSNDDNLYDDELNEEVGAYEEEPEDNSDFSYLNNSNDFAIKTSNDDVVFDEEDAEDFEIVESFEKEEPFVEPVSSKLNENLSETDSANFEIRQERHIEEKTPVENTSNLEKVLNPEKKKPIIKRKDGVVIEINQDATPKRKNTSSSSATLNQNMNFNSFNITNLEATRKVVSNEDKKAEKYSDIAKDKGEFMRKISVGKTQQRTENVRNSMQKSSETNSDSNSAQDNNFNFTRTKYGTLGSIMIQNPLMQTSAETTNRKQNHSKLAKSNASNFSFNLNELTDSNENENDENKTDEGDGKVKMKGGTVVVNNSPSRHTLKQKANSSENKIGKLYSGNVVINQNSNSEEKKDGKQKQEKVSFFNKTEFNEPIKTKKNNNT